MSSELTLERIRDIIIEAYAQVDLSQREQLLIKADNLEQQLVTVYERKGLKLTANNIAHALEMVKRNQYKRSL